MFLLAVSVFTGLENKAHKMFIYLLIHMPTLINVYGK